MNEEKHEARGLSGGFHELWSSKSPDLDPAEHLDLCKTTAPLQLFCETVLSASQKAHCVTMTTGNCELSLAAVLLHIIIFNTVISCLFLLF